VPGLDGEPGRRHRPPRFLGRRTTAIALFIYLI
jgi:hypothetical protein